MKLCIRFGWPLTLFGTAPRYVWRSVTTSRWTSLQFPSMTRARGAARVTAARAVRPQMGAQHPRGQWPEGGRNTAETSEQREPSIISDAELSCFHVVSNNKICWITTKSPLSVCLKWSQSIIMSSCQANSQSSEYLLQNNYLLFKGWILYVMNLKYYCERQNIS